jgi:hypothetical protein
MDIKNLNNLKDVNNILSSLDSEIIEKWNSKKRRKKNDRRLLLNWSYKRCKRLIYGSDNMKRQWNKSSNLHIIEKK